MLTIDSSRNLPSTRSKMNLTKEEWIEHYFWKSIDPTSWELDDSTFVFTLFAYTMNFDDMGNGLPLVYP